MDGELSIFTTVKEIQRIIQGKLEEVSANFLNVTCNFKQKHAFFSFYLDCLEKFCLINDCINSYLEENQDFFQNNAMNRKTDFGCQFDSFCDGEFLQSPINVQVESLNSNDTIVPCAINSTDDSESVKTESDVILPQSDITVFESDLIELKQNNDEDPEMYFDYSNQFLAKDDSFHTCEEEDVIIAGNFLNNTPNDKLTSTEEYETDSIKKLKKTILSYNLGLTENDIIIEPLNNSKNEMRRKKTIPKFYELIDDKLFLNATCTFSHVESPTEFYVQKSAKFVNDINEELNYQLNKLYFKTTNSFKTKIETKEKIGNYCFAYSTQWYRAEILDWMIDDVIEETEDVLLQLVDFGTKIRCSFRELKQLNDFFSKFPKMAIKCHLAECYPALSTDMVKLRSWPGGTIDTLVNLSGVKLETKRKFQIIYATKEENGSYGIDLFEMERNDGKTIGEILLEMNLVRQIQILVPNSDNSVFNFDDDSDCELEDMNINELVHGYDAKDLQRICRFTKNGTCFKGANCKLEHIELSKAGITTDKELISIQPFESFNFPQKNDYVTIVITHFLSCCHFYGHIVRKTCKSIYDRDLTVLNKKMMSKENILTYERFKIYPAIGELVLVNVKGFWQRGRYVSVTNSSEIVQIFLVDFGNNVYVNKKDLRKMKDDFLYLPFQAIECYLTNFEQKKNIDKKQLEGFCEESLVLKSYQACVIEPTEPLGLKVFDKNWLNIGDIMVNFGYAVEVTDNKEGFVQNIFPG